MIKNKLSAMFDDKPVDRAEMARSVRLAMQIVDETIPDGPMMEDFRNIAFDNILAFLLEYDVTE